MFQRSFQDPKSMYYTLVSEAFQGWESSVEAIYLAARSKVPLIAWLAFNDRTSACWRL